MTFTEAAVVLTVGALGLLCTLALIVIVIGRWARQEDETRAFNRLLAAAAEFDAREQLEGLWELPAREPRR